MRFTVPKAPRNRSWKIVRWFRCRVLGVHVNGYVDEKGTFHCHDCPYVEVTQAEVIG